MHDFITILCMTSSLYTVHDIIVLSCVRGAAGKHEPGGSKAPLYCLMVEGGRRLAVPRHSTHPMHTLQAQYIQVTANNATC